MNETVIVNGTPRACPQRLSIEELVAEVLPRRETTVGESSGGVAVAVNDVVLPRRHWARTMITDGDRIEIVTAVQGG